MAEKQKNEWDEREIGALWTRESASSGEKFWTGKIKVGDDEVEVIAMRNRFKEEGDNKPSLRIYKSKPLDEKKSNQKRVEDEDLPI